MKTYTLTINTGTKSYQTKVENTDMGRTDAMIFAAQREGVSLSCVTIDKMEEKR